MSAQLSSQRQFQQSRPPQKKYYKVVIRKLPPSDFAKDDFLASLKEFCSVLGIPDACCRFLHYIQGKNSRSRGPLGSAGFISFEDEEIFKKFLSQTPPKAPFLGSEDPAFQPPEISSPLYQKTTKPKLRPDKIEGSYLSDPEFVAFSATLETPVTKRLSAELQLDLLEKSSIAAAAAQSAAVKSKSVASAAVATSTPVVSSVVSSSSANASQVNWTGQAKEDPKSTPLLMFLKQRAENKLLERKLSAKGAKTPAPLSGGSKGVSGARLKADKRQPKGNVGKESKFDGQRPVKPSSGQKQSQMQPNKGPMPSSVQPKVLKRNPGPLFPAPASAGEVLLSPPIQKGTPQHNLKVSSSVFVPGIAIQDGNSLQVSRRQKERDRQTRKQGGMMNAGDDTGSAGVPRNDSMPRKPKPKPSVNSSQVQTGGSSGV